MHVHVAQKLLDCLFEAFLDLVQINILIPSLIFWSGHKWLPFTLFRRLIVSRTQLYFWCSSPVAILLDYHEVQIYFNNPSQAPCIKIQCKNCTLLGSGTGFATLKHTPYWQRFYFEGKYTPTASRHFHLVPNTCRIIDLPRDTTPYNA